MSDPPKSSQPTAPATDPLALPAQRPGDPGWPRWDDPERLYWDKPHRIKAYRALQSWYRETELGVPPGPHPHIRTQLAGNTLRNSEAQRDKNFFDGVGRYARKRAGWLASVGATAVYPRLDHNMLGSMPLCFNLFGFLREHPESTAALLRNVLGRNLGKIIAIEVEVPPHRKKDYLGDNTSFDALVAYESGGSLGFLAIETKYTEKFSAVPSAKSQKDQKARWKLEHHEPYKAYSTERYGWLPGAFEQLAFSRTSSQLWRNLLLALRVKEKGLSDGTLPTAYERRPFDEMQVLVMSARADRTACDAVKAVNASRAGHEKIKHILFEDLTRAAREIDQLSGWANGFERRYLDLTPVFESPTFAGLRVDLELRRPLD